MLDHFLDGLARVEHVVDEKDLALQGRKAGHAFRNVERALNGALGFTVGARRENGEGLAEDAAEEVAGAHAAAGEAEEAVELPLLATL